MYRVYPPFRSRPHGFVVGPRGPIPDVPDRGGEGFVKINHRYPYRTRELKTLEVNDSFARVWGSYHLDRTARTRTTAESVSSLLFFSPIRALTRKTPLHCYGVRTRDNNQCRRFSRLPRRMRLTRITRCSRCSARDVQSRRTIFHVVSICRRRRRNPYARVFNTRLFFAVTGRENPSRCGGR